jgi:hypothetical protein
MYNTTNSLTSRPANVHESCMSRGSPAVLALALLDLKQ